MSHQDEAGTPSEGGTAHSEATAATHRLNCQGLDFADPKEALGCEHEWRTDTFFSGFRRRQVKKSCVKCGEVVVSEDDAQQGKCLRGEHEAMHWAHDYLREEGSGTTVVDVCKHCRCLYVEK